MFDLRSTTGSRRKPGEARRSAAMVLGEVALVSLVGWFLSCKCGKAMLNKQCRVRSLRLEHQVRHEAEHNATTEDRRSRQRHDQQVKQQEKVAGGEETWKRSGLIKNDPFKQQEQRLTCAVTSMTKPSDLAEQHETSESLADSTLLEWEPTAGAMNHDKSGLTCALTPIFAKSNAFDVRFTKQLQEDLDDLLDVPVIGKASEGDNDEVSELDELVLLKWPAVDDDNNIFAETHDSDTSWLSIPHSDSSCKSTSMQLPRRLAKMPKPQNQKFFHRIRTAKPVYDKYKEKSFVYQTRLQDALKRQGKLHPTDSILKSKQDHAQQAKHWNLVNLYKTTTTHKQIYKSSISSA